MNKELEAQILKDLDDAIEAPRKDHKIRVTINLDGDVLDKIKEIAEKDGLKYQPWLNSFLRKSLIEGPSIEDRLAKLEKDFYKKKTVNG